MQGRGASGTEDPKPVKKAPPSGESGKGRHFKKDLQTPKAPGNRFLHS